MINVSILYDLSRQIVLNNLNKRESTARFGDEKKKGSSQIDKVVSSIFLSENIKNIKIEIQI